MHSVAAPAPAVCANDHGMVGCVYVFERSNTSFLHQPLRYFKIVN